MFDNIGDAVLTWAMVVARLTTSEFVDKGTLVAHMYAVAWSMRAFRRRLVPRDLRERRRSEQRADHAKISVATSVLLEFEHRLAESSAHS
ncbi:hypothetical protein PPMP20_23285 [Paraburkholderia phymatum]|uniref:hypothetical protein n=1 Tax=Paraburkholderia phymatum TaxID=148447 RepID=UPI0012FD4128|nr:hypothetical protein [Paraburkholderia phymatum]